MLQVVIWCYDVAWGIMRGVGQHSRMESTLSDVGCGMWDGMWHMAYGTWERGAMWDLKCILWHVGYVVRAPIARILSLKDQGSPFPGLASKGEPHDLLL